MNNENRVIKHRAKRKDVRFWKYGYLFEDITLARHISYIIEGGFVPAFSMPASYFVEVDPETICEFFGEKDRHGTDVYTMDILEWEGMNGKMERGVFLWDQNSRSFKMRCDATVKVTNENMAIIGNLIDHPELLTK